MSRVVVHHDAEHDFSAARIQLLGKYRSHGAEHVRRLRTRQIAQVAATAENIELVLGTETLRPRGLAETFVETLARIGYARALAVHQQVKLEGARERCDIALEVLDQVGAG